MRNAGKGVSWVLRTGAIVFAAACAVAASIAEAGEASAEKALAERILAATGVRGGLIVHVGCGDGKLTAALHANDSYLVHGLDTDRAMVAKAREHIRSLGIYGVVSVDRQSGNRLPYAENLVNLLVAEQLGNIPMDEAMRVLCPDGVAYVGKNGRWTKTVKPRPKEIDEWTHYLHDATNNAVAHDSVVGPPRHFQWIGSPRWSRHHDHMASMSALVSAGGRNFYIFDEGPTSAIVLPSKWALIARDAFNGTILWKRPIEEWHTRLWPLKSGPAQLPRRLVAVGSRVYVTLGLRAPLSALDAVTGETIRTYKETQATEELILSEGVLFLLVKDPARMDLTRRWDEAVRRVMAVEAESGKVLWKRDYRVLPLTLAADSQRVYLHDGEKLVALDRNDGRELWRSPAITRLRAIPTHFAPTLVVHQDVVLFAGGENYTPHRGARDKLTAVSATDGRVLWSAPHPCCGYQSPEDVLVIGGLVWSGDMTNPRNTGIVTGRDPRTGEVKSQFKADDWPHMPHHRCHRSKATDKYYIASRTGIEFVDVQAKHWIAHHWVRGGCLYGLMPCNGLIYTPAHDCACYIESKLNAFNALAPGGRFQVPGSGLQDGRLERGPAYGESPEPETRNPEPDAWPTYRHDAARSGCTKAAVPADLKRVWQAELGGKLSSVVVADGKVFVASVDTHAVHALDAASGKRAWSFTAGGRVDSPPTVWQGRVLFGSADGHVYCVRSADGALVWRFRAAPVDRRMTAFEQVESVWPVHGSVLVQGDAVYCVAGRSMFMDGGLRLLRLDPRTGRKLSETILDDRHPETGKNLQTNLRWPNLPVALPDVLSSDGRNVYMRSLAFDLGGKRRYVKHIPVAQQQGDDVHLFSPTGLLDDAWWHRSYWVYGRAFEAGAGGYYRAGRLVPAGRILVFDDSTVYGFGRRWQYFRWTTPLEYHLFAAAKQADVLPPTSPAARAAKAKKRRRARPAHTRFACQWSKEAPLLARAMVLADSTLFVAGPPDLLDEGQARRASRDASVQKKLAEQAAALEGSKGALLLAVSAPDGKLASALQLDSLPVFDGMAAAGGRLFMSTVDGEVVCLGGQGEALTRAAGAELNETPAHRLPARAPRRPPIKETTSHPDFQHLSRVQVTSCDLGYRLRTGPNQVGFALKKLAAPLRKQATFAVRLKMLPNDDSPIPPANAFLAFGDGPDDERLVKCGLRSRMKRCAIVQGPLVTGRPTVKPLAPKANKVIDLRVAVDLGTQKVTMSVLGQTVVAPLERRMEAITFVGYCVHSVATEYSRIEIKGQ